MHPLFRKIAGFGLIFFAIIVVLAQLKTCMQPYPTGDGAFEAGKSTGHGMAGLLFFVAAFFMARAGLRLIRKDTTEKNDDQP